MKPVETTTEYVHRLTKIELTRRFKGESAEDFETWQKDFLSWYTGLFEAYEPQSSFNITPPFEIVGEKEWHGCTRVDIRYLNPFYDLTVPATVLIPDKEKSNGAGLVVQHGHGYHGRLPIIGDRSSSGIIEETQKHNYAIGLHLAQNGYTVFALDLLGFGERTEPRKELRAKIKRDACDMFALFLSLYGINLVAQQASDIRHAVSILSDWPGVDKERIGMCGLSQGGRMTMYTSALDTRIRAIVASGACNTFHDRLTLLKGACGAQIMQGLMPGADTADIFSALAPRPLQIQWGLQDPGIIPEYSEPGVQQIARTYQAAQAEDRFEIYKFEGGHVFDYDSALRWFDTWM